MKKQNNFSHPELPYAKNGFRYNAYRYYLENQFGQPVQRVSLEGGFTCPNRDGYAGFGGCIFCNNESFSPPYSREDAAISEQLEQGIAYLEKRFEAQKFLAYFQSYTNTYKPLAELERLYRAALDHPKVVGLAISTRADVLPDDLLRLLKDISQDYYLNLEIGIESFYDASLEWMNRGHSAAETREGIERAVAYGITVSGHLILGLPGETEAMMLQEAEFLNSLPLQMLKLHHLQVIENTQLAKNFSENPFPLFEYEDYLRLAAKFIARLRPELVLQRFFTEAPRNYLVAPKWGKRSTEIVMDMQRLMRELDLWQGKFYQK
jgi:uncharacterized protein